MVSTPSQRLRTVRVSVLLACLLLLAASSLAEETVAFNTESKKYHCLDCQWARRCTKNCIRISLSEARRRGGVACKVCGGTCGRSVHEQASQPLEPQHHDTGQQSSPQPW